MTANRIQVAHETVDDFGATLRLEREGRGISLRDIATTTKISVRWLEALERNQVKQLPGGVFTRSFVRTYAVEVGLDPERTLQDFLTAFPDVQRPETSASIDHEPVVQDWRGWPMVVGVFIVLGLIAAKYYIW